MPEPSARPPGAAAITLGELQGIPVERLRGIGEKKQRSLAEVGVTTVLDLLTTYPRRWVDRTNEARICDLVPGTEALVLASVRSVSKRMMRNRRTMVEAVVGDSSGSLHVVFFNQPWRERQLREGVEVLLFGKADVFRGGLQMSNPIVDLIGDRTGRIVPIYPQSDKAQLTTWEIAGWVDNALERCAARGLADPVPAGLLHELDLLDRTAAMRAIHNPETMRDKERARRRLAFDELLRVQTLLVMRKRAYERDRRGIRHPVRGELVRRFHDALPYELTAAQRRTIAEIDTDLSSPSPMHRLLQGDVGSGKTVVAVTALLAAVQGGRQAALMAPTEVLAEQHATAIRVMLAGLEVPAPDSLFGDRPINIALFTNRITGPERREVLAGLASGVVDLVIGTHALIQDGVEFAALGVVVVDEQHRFGVEQRAALGRKSTGGDPTAEGHDEPFVADVMVMTATPIPRTAAMTVYGDLDVSVLDELPPGRTPIETRWANGEDAQEAVWADVRAAIAAQRQAYVVCPMIEDSDKADVASAQETFDWLVAGHLREARLGLLHGRLPPAEKERVMDAFRRRDLDVLVATTVIEVGVDVPNATVMVILDADRFGIASLHQLRGRVGRGRHASTCWLSTAASEGASPRVEAVVSSTDGFVLAEADLDLRGEGTLMGKAQKGRSDLKLASLRRDRELVALARRTAFAIVDADPMLDTHSQLLDEVRLLLDVDDDSFLFKS